MSVSKIRKSVWAVLLALMLALVLVPTEALATTTKSVKNFAYGTPNPTVMAKATTVKQGKQILKLAKGNGACVMKFKAPTTKTYTFTFSKLSSSSSATVGIASFQTITRTSQSALKIKLSEGNRRVAPFYSANVADGGKFKAGNATYKRVKTRAVKLKMTKGQTVYIVSTFTNQNSNPVAAKCLLNIK